MENLKEILNNFLNKKVLVIGDVMLDKYTIGRVKRISPEAPVPVLSVEKEEYKPGGAANVALNVATLSPTSRVYLFGFVGNDFFGNHLKKILEEKGVRCYFKSDFSTITKERIIGWTSGQKQHIIRVDREESFKKFFDNYDNILEIAKQSDIIIISDYAKGSITSDLISYLHPYKNKIIIDPKPGNKDYKAIYKNAFLITPSKDEAIAMTGFYEIDEAGYFLRREFDSNILITLGKDGMKLFSINNKINGNSVYIETTPEESFEETGAGDTAIAAIALALSSSNNSLEYLINAAKIGNLAAGITVKHVGTYAPTFHELMEKILSLEQ